MRNPLKATTLHEHVFEEMLMSGNAIALFVYIFFLFPSYATYTISCVKTDGKMPGQRRFLNTRS